MRKLIIVSNRLPVTISTRNGGIDVTSSVGGLATGLASFYRERNSEWIGWPGGSIESFTPDQRREIAERLMDQNCQPVFLSEGEIDGYYKGFSNQTLWPLFHYFPSYARYEESDWTDYVTVNQRFADMVVDRSSAEDTIWVHDYQLLLLPRMLRDRLPQARIGFFLHIPFPSSEILKLIPQRNELLEGMMGADLVGFHTFDYVRHFLASIGGILGRFPVPMGKMLIPCEDRLVRADAFPMGIDFSRFSGESVERSPSEELASINEDEDRKLILSIDRLDYSKGMLHRLGAFERFLEEHPERHGKVTLILKAIASRSGIAQYDRLRRSLDEAVGHINGRFGTLSWVPVRYLFRFLPEETLIDLYRRADVALLTPLRDGMNLIAKEYLAAKIDEDGVLILSELAGAAHELREALIVNPNNHRQIAEAIETALAMPPEERQQRCHAMRQRIQQHDTVCWAKDFLSELDAVHLLRRHLHTTRIRGETRTRLVNQYRSSSSRLLLLDYDGTLTERTPDPAASRPSGQLLRLLGSLCADPRNSVVVLSGRGREVMDSWFGSLPLRLSAEHGVWMRTPEGTWTMPRTPTREWKKELQSVLEIYTRRTPGSRVEAKEYSLVWDYSRTIRAFGTSRMAELLADISPILQTYMLDVLQGEGFVEIRSAGVSQADLAKQWLMEEPYSFVFCAGDDASDEDVFAILPSHAFGVRIGTSPSRARYSMLNSAELRKLLQELVSTGRTLSSSQTDS
jgi:trehalose 6-phosphate synthase/phosphatase